MIVNLKEFGVLSGYGHTFILRTRTMFYSEIKASERSWIEPLAGKYTADVNEVQRTRLEELRLLSSSELTDASVRQYDEFILSKTSVVQRNISAIELMVAQQCNMRCVYCYGNGGEYGASGRMSEETARRSVDFLYEEWCRNEHKPDDKPHILFFGGEPLMGFAAIRAAVEYSETIFGADGVTYGMTTNATLITDEIAEFLSRHHFKVSISLDGPAEYQRHHRPLRNGKDSYAETVNKIALLRKYMTVDSAIATMMPDENRDLVVKALHENGLIHYRINPASGVMIKGVCRQGFGEEFVRREADLQLRTPLVLDAVKRRDRAALMDSLSDDVYRDWFSRALAARIPEYKPSYCGCGRSMVTISINGDFYPCHSFVGQPAYRQGSLDDGYQRGIFAKHLSLENPRCKGCPVRYGCGGECIYSSASDAPDECCANVVPIFRVWPAFCTLKKTQLTFQMVIHTELTNDDKCWIHAQADSIMRTVKSERLSDLLFD